MNNLKNKAGFTLVELIVVIAVLAILAGVAIPTYTGYIEKAEEAAMMQQLSTVNTAVQGLAAAEGATVESISVTEQSGAAAATDGDDDYKVTVTAKKGEADVTISDKDVEALTGDLDFGDKFASASWADGKWTITRAN